MSLSNNFVPVGEGIWLSKGDEVLFETEISSHPTLIIVFGWMNAQLPHLHKYTQIYRELYPRATIVLIQSNSSIFWISERARRAKLQPAAELLVSLNCMPPTDQRILVHSFSNGGTLQLKTLGSILPTSTASRLPQSVIIFDSAPGQGSLSSFVKAFTAGIRNPIANLLAIPLLSTCYGIFSLLTFVGFNVGVIAAARKALWEERLLPWTNRWTPRLYVYSKVDRMVAWKDVQAHVEEGRQLGFNVRTEVFGDSPHVAHARADPERYWSAVGIIWTDSSRVFSKMFSA